MTLKQKTQLKDIPLNLKIGTKKEAAWTKIKEKLEDDLLNSEIEKQINETILELAKKEIEKEKNLNS